MIYTHARITVFILFFVQCPSNKWPCRSAVKRICPATRRPVETTTSRPPRRILPDFSWSCGLKSERRSVRKTRVTGVQLLLRPPLENPYSRECNVTKNCKKIEFHILHAHRVETLLPIANAEKFKFTRDDCIDRQVCEPFYLITNTGLVGYPLLRVQRVL